MKKICQSCGFPLSKDKSGGGSNKDGSISDKYCSMCFKGGEFLSPPEIDTAKKFQVYCIEQMKKDCINSWIAWLVTRGIKKLERWR